MEFKITRSAPGYGQPTTQVVELPEVVSFAVQLARVLHVFVYGEKVTIERCAEHWRLLEGNESNA
jgi:hypothetical protein